MADSDENNYMRRLAEKWMKKLDDRSQKKKLVAAQPSPVVQPVAQPRGVFQRPQGGYDRANRRFINFQRNTKNSFRSGIKTFDRGPHTWFFIAVLILIHAYDALYANFSRANPYLTTLFTAYVLVALYATFFYYRTGLSTESGKYFLFSAFAFGLPYITKISFFSDNDYLLFAIAASPIWFLFVALSEKEDSPLHTAGRLWTIAIVLTFAIIILAGTVVPGALSVPGTAQVGKSVLVVVGDFKDAIYRIGDRFKDNCLFSRACIVK